MNGRTRQNRRGPILEVKVSSEENRVTISVTIPANTFSFFQRCMKSKGMTIEEYVKETAIDELRDMVDTMPKDELLKCLGLIP